MSKTNEWVDGSRTPAHGTRTRSLRGGWGMVWGRFVAVVVVGACVAWGMGTGGVARGQGVTKEIRVSPEFRTWYEQHKESEMSRRGRGAKEPIHEGEGSGYGLIPDLYDMSYLSRLNVGVVQTVGASYPQRYDLRDKGWVTDVKNQHPYGTCWAHATFGSLESHLKKSQGVEYDFSENNLVNLQEWDYSGWSGANAAAAEGYLLHWMGPVMEEDDHYYAVNGSEPMAPAYHVQQVRWIPGKSSATDNDRIKEAVTQYGGLWVSYYHEDPYLSPNNAYYYTGNSNGNHAVTLVGWDDAYPKENFASEPPGDGAYIVKNSWGKRWGEDGYFYVSYYDIRFARSTMYAFCNADSTNNYGKVYEYDPLGFVYESLWRSSTCKQWGANIFTATGDDTLAAVGFYALGPNTSYKISVYTGVSEGAPTSGTSAVSEQSGTLDTAGYFTIPLDKEVKVGKGKRFSVVVEVKTPGHTAPLGLEIALWDVVEKGSDYPTSEATAAKGQSFISFDGATWYDMFLNEEKYRPNFCCKVYTKSATAEKPKLTGVSIHAVDGRSVESGKTGRFRCDATYENGGKKEGVAAKWSVVKGDEWADIDEDTGVLQAEEVGENHTVTIRAVYTEDGVTVDAKGDVQITAGAPGVPKNVKGTAELDNANSLNATISWDAVSGASKYAVYRGDTDAARNARHVYTVAVAKYMDGDAVPGRKYWYFVKAQNGEGSGTLSSDFSTGVQGWRLLAPPTDVKATTDLTDRIDVSWGASAGATHYRVSRSVAPGGTREVLGEWQTDLRFIDRPAQADTPYYYYVAAALDASGSMAAEGELYAEGIRPSPAVPVLEVRGPDSLGSGEDGDFEAYVTYSKGKADEGPLDVKWSVSEGSVSKNGTKARVTAPKMTSSGKVTVTATHERTGLVGRKDVTVTAGLPGQVTGLKVTSATAGGIGLSWNAAEGAGGYVVARTGGKGGEATFKTAQTAYTDTTAEVGVEYSYTVSAENAAGGGTPSEPVAAFIGLSAPGGVSATGDRSDCVRVKWSGTAGATHFRVGRATSRSGSKTTLGSGWTAERTYDDVPPKDNTEYWYFVKAATGADGSHASAWSEGAPGKRLPEKTLEGVAISGPDRVGSGEVAVYSCVAEWSGEEQGTTVAAQWSASKGSIGKSDGQFQAPSVTADTEVSIVAKYGGMAATQTVTVVGAGVEATAEITKVSAAQRWPFEGLVDIDYTLVTSPSGTKAVIAVSGLDEDHGTTLAATTLEGYGAGGAAVSPGNLRVTWDIGTDYPGLNAASVRVDVTAAVAAQGCVEGLTAAGTADGIVLGWNAAEGATEYQVWRGTSSLSSGAGRIATVSAADHTDKSAKAGIRYWYWIKAVSAAGVSGFSEPADAVRPPAAPTGLTATAGSGGIEVAWSASEGATGYEVWRNASNSTTGAEKAATVAGTSWTDSGAGAGTWYYWVKATCAAETSGFSAVASATGGLEVPVVTVRNATTTNGWALSVSWTAVDGAASYEVWRGTGDSFDAAAKRTTSAGTNWVDASVTANTTYTYWVVAKNGALEGRSEGVQGTPSGNLMPLRSLLTGLEARVPDGVLSDKELDRAMANPGLADMDGHPEAISEEEMAIFQWIQRLNQDKDLISNVIKGDYSGISAGTLLELFQLSEKVRILTDLTPCVTATQGTGSGALIRVSWGKRSSNILSYEVYRSTTTNGTPTLVATVTATNWVDTDVTYRHPYWYRVKAVYETLTTGFSGKAKGYWGDWCLPDNNNLMPLRSLLTSIDAVKNLDGVLSETEMNRVMSNSTIIDMDGDPTKISDAEMSIFQRIKTLNQDPALITALIQGDYTYAGMSEAEFLECYSLSETIRTLTKY